MEINVEERVAAARAFFREGYNCCQSVVLAFEDIAGLDKDSIIKAACGFGGGMGRMREVCGTVSAMVMLAGFISPVPSPKDMEARKANYALVQHLADSFRKENGTIYCRELLGMGFEPHKESPQPSERTAEYYKKRPCEELVGLSAGFVANYLKTL